MGRQHCYVGVAVVPANYSYGHACAAADVISKGTAGRHLLRAGLNAILCKQVE